MNRIEYNVQTGVMSSIPLTQEEVEAVMIATAEEEKKRAETPKWISLTSLLALLLEKKIISEDDLTKWLPS